jgi:hypothetical protein
MIWTLSAVAIVIGSYVIAKRLGFERQYKDLLLPVILVTVPVLVTGFYTNANSEAETRVKYLQIAADILNRGPRQDEINIRKWAFNLIKQYSPVEIDEATERAMIYGRADIHEAPDTLEGTGTVK